jgi:serine/threonine-protein kinase
VNTTLPHSGEVFDFRYRIVCRLGFGGDGYLFGATELDTGKRVAIKCWNGPHAEQALAAAQSFVRTANEVRLFDNPHIVEVFAAEAGRTVSYCVMDWMEGMTLARRIMRRRPSPLSDVFNIVVPCMRAVVEAHAAGIVHGDVRPGHIFVCHATKHRAAIARIFDFGRGPAGLPSIPNVASAVNAEAYHYATPEQLKAAPLDARSDMYAFGIMLFEMLAGERPFVAASSDELAQKIKEGTPKLLASISPSIPVRLAHVVERAMAGDPAQRYASLSEMIEALQPFNPAGSHAYVSVPAVSVSKSTALAIRNVVAERTRTRPPPPPPVRRVLSAQASEIEDITTTSASWELTEPLAIGRYQYELLRRIGWRRAAVWGLVLATAVLGARYAQQAATATSPLPSRDFAAPSPAYGFDPATCNDPIGATDPNCAHVIAPLPVPAVLTPVLPLPPLKPLQARTDSEPPVQQTPAATSSRPGAARSESSSRSRSAHSHDMSAKPLASSKQTAARSAQDKKPFVKRSRNTTGSRTNDPFERLDHMRLQ